jgi:hypothetical protein
MNVSLIVIGYIMNSFAKEVIKRAYELKTTSIAWRTTGLTGDDHTFKRSKPAPFLKFLYDINKDFPFKNIIEIGSNRHAVTQQCVDYFFQEHHAIEAPACCADGHSTYFFSLFGGNVHTVDIDMNRIDAINHCYHHLNQEKPSNLYLHIPKDGIEFLNEFNDTVDLLFLDGWDVGTHNYAENHLLAYETIKNKLSENCIIGIDDTDFTGEVTGKDKLLGAALIEDGYVPFIKGRQALFIKP